MLRHTISTRHAQRRKRAMTENAGASFLIFAPELVIRNQDVYFPFRQDSYFYYLTGFEEAESALVMTATGKTVLFVMRRDAEREIWEGERYGVEGALTTFGVDATYPIEELPSRLPELLKGSERLYYRQKMSERQDRLVLEALERHRTSDGRSGRGLLSVMDPSMILAEMRMFKDEEEVESLRKACSITARAHLKLMQTVRPGQNEGEVEALVDYEFRRNGCHRNGYGSIVAGGKNATCLHYHSNNEVLKDGDLLLVDAGGEYDYFTSDITRTFPVGRRFTDDQARFYDLVLESQMAAIAMAKPGNTLAAIHRKATEVLTQGLIDMSLLSGSVDELIKSGAIKRFYPHGTGHWLGMDVHDVGLYQIKNKELKDEPRPLKPGMCFTIEPGLYIQPGDLDAPPEYRGIGIRIEDDILITESGCEVLTHEAPKLRSDIETIRAV